MNSPQGRRRRARARHPVTPVILRGAAWKARDIPNHCLRRHCHVLAATFRKEQYASLRALCGRLFPVLETRSRVLTEIHPTELAVVAGVARLGAYVAHWVREPEDWLPDPAANGLSQWADLLRHLLARYPVPSFLDLAWELPGELRHFERDCWCALAQGVSLRLVDGFPPGIPHRVLHSALTGSSNGGRRTFAHAIWTAQLKALDASPALTEAILTSRVPFDLGNYALWSRLAAKFSTASDAVALRFGFVVEVLVAVRGHRGAVQVEQLLRLSLATLIRHCVRFATALLNSDGHRLTESQVSEAAGRTDLSRLANSRWQPVLGPVPFASKRAQVAGQTTWTIEELCSLDALRLEGDAMKHCVAGYASGCRNGSSAIFSVRQYLPNREGTLQNISHATIQLHPASGKIVQIRGFQNRPVNQTVMDIVDEWAAAKGLECTG